MILFTYLIYCKTRYLVVWFFVQLLLLMGTVQSKLPDEYSNVEGNCELLLENYAVITANFTRCVIRHARPIMVCEKCIEEFLNVEESHYNILKLHEDSGEACKIELLNVDRLEVIENSFKFVTTQWDNAACQKCFIRTPNSTQLSPETLKIFQLYKDTKNCLENSKPDNSSLICDICKGNYSQLNNYYAKQGSHRKFCMDVVDMINSTRYEWSNKFNCSIVREKPELIFVVSSISICVLPIFFYFSIWLHSVRSFPQSWIRNRHESPRLIN